MRFDNFVALFFVSSVMGAATILSSASCGNTTTTTSTDTLAACSGALNYADAYTLATVSGNMATISALSYSSYTYSPLSPQAEQNGASAETTFSDTLASGGATRAGYAEIVFSSLFISENELASTNASLIISLNGDNLYNCSIVVGFGANTCPTNTIMAPIELGMPFILTVDDLSSSPAPSFEGGISTSFTVSLLDADTSTAVGVSEILAAPEPATMGLIAVGLSVLAVSRHRTKRT